jgi:REP element-mobilizing transposase RayT
MTKAEKRSSTRTTQAKKSRQEHGGSLAIGRRRKTRPLNIKQSHHITLKSIHAVGPRSLFRHKKMILSLMKKYSFRFQVKVYEYAIQGNHIHLLIKAQSREGMQNFFRVIAGHSAQRILKEFPLNQNAGGASGHGRQKAGCKKNQRVFWSYLIYSRVVSWGQEFETVTAYIQKNTLELLQIIAYQPRFKSANKNSS